MNPTEPPSPTSPTSPDWRPFSISVDSRTTPTSLASPDPRTSVIPSASPDPRSSSPTSSDPRTSPDEPLDPAAALRLVTEQTSRVKADDLGITVINLAAWGVAWLFGYGALYVGALVTEGMPPAWSFIVFGALIIAAIMVSAVVGIRRGSVVVGPSRLAGAFWGWSWFVGFVAMSTMIGVAAERYDLSGEAVGALTNAMAALLVGVLYMTGAAVFKERVMFVCGVMFVVLALVGTIIGLPVGYLVMSLVGGGSMLVGLIIVAIIGRRSRR
ncbi:MAG: hypothetical protein LBV06_00895 [Propionibacteriaceae bacterium]|jgi:hypothetical protein|nr:hypothetical protein [Propionibacteriaceae bacterium]